MNKKIIKKTYRKIDAIAKTGKDGILNYKKIIDSIIDNNEFDILYEVMLHYYNIDIQQFKDVDGIKRNTFDIVRLHTKSYFQDNMTLMQNKLGFYTIGLNVFKLSNNAYLGKIHQSGQEYYVTTLIDTYAITGSGEIDIYNQSISKIFVDYANLNNNNTTE